MGGGLYEFPSTVSRTTLKRLLLIILAGLIAAIILAVLSSYNVVSLWIFEGAVIAWVCIVVSIAFYLAE
jgi:undecaprenyl pyrophosphate phosphatase UppP